MRTYSPASPSFSSRVLEGTSFEPFNDLGIAFYGKRPTAGSGSLDVSQISSYREGVNLQTIRDVFDSSQPKISACDAQSGFPAKPNGTINHFVQFGQLGQPSSITQYTLSSSFTDRISVTQGTVPYLLKSSNGGDVAVVLNGGSQFDEEARESIRPLGTVFLDRSTVVSASSGLQCSNLQTGASFERGDVFGTQEVGQFVPRNGTPKAKFRPFAADSAILSVASFSLINPWVDQCAPKESWVSTVVFQKFFIASGSMADSTTAAIQSPRTVTACAGWPQQQQSVYGTDSVAFSGYLRGV